jgi:uncharacterized membrane protein YdjX (TVP38/TMEM64 family)
MRWLAVGAVVLALILIPFFLWGDALSAWAQGQLHGANRWYLALVIAALLVSDAFLPVPSSIVSTSAGALLGFAAGAAASTIGMCVAAGLGYAVGALAPRRVMRRAVGNAGAVHAHLLVDRYGALALMLTRPVPVLAEATVVAAGFSKMRVAEFAMVAALSNIGIGAGYAAVGAFSYRTGSFLPAFAGAVGVPAAAMALNRVFRARPV